MSKPSIPAVIPFLGLAALLLASAAHASTYNFHDWAAATFSGGTWTWTATSPAGPITATNVAGGWSPAPGSWGLPAQITAQGLTREFHVSPLLIGKQLIVTFPPNFAWGTGGELAIGNIHNWFSYTLSAWEPNGTPINVNNWTTPTGLSSEYLTGGSGYFATSNTTSTPSGNSRVFSVSDSSASPTFGQGGVIPLLMTNAGNADNVGKLTLTLTSVNLPPNVPAGVDFLLFNVATPPENGLLKVCKVAGIGVAVGTPFSFTAGASTFTVPAGPPPAGTCVVGPTFPVGTTVTVDEVVPPGHAVASITVAPPGQQIGMANLAAGSVNVTIGTGVTEVTFTDKRTGFVEICKRGHMTGNFNFTVNPGALGPFAVPAGACSPAIEVAAGQVVIHELPAGGVMAGCAAIPAAHQGPCNLGARTSTVTVVPGDVSTMTIAFITNQQFHPAPDSSHIPDGAVAATLACAPNPAPLGRPVACTAKVAALQPKAGIPTGTVGFLEGNTTLGEARLSAAGTAVFTTSTLPAGPHAIVAAYSGDAKFGESVSQPVTITVEQP